MRRILALTMLVAACTEEPPPDDPPPETWSVDWTCTFRCAEAPPNNVSNTTLTIDGRTLTWTGSAIGEVHVASEIDGDGCYVVPEADEANRTRKEYRLCPRPAGQLGMFADVSWTVALNTEAFSTWRADVFQ